MPTVDINGSPYEVYASVAAATTYLQADLNYSELWSVFANQESALVSATRMLDSKRWLGSKTEVTQPLEWPRTGVEDIDEATVPQEVIDACCLLAGMLAQKPSLSQSSNTGSNRKSVMAGGGVGVEYFGPVRGKQFPDAVNDLVRDFLDSAVGVAAPFVGATTKTHFPDNRFQVGGYHG